MFLTTDVMLITKSDLLPYVPFSVEAVIKDAHEVNGSIEIFVLSSLKREGMSAWCDWLTEQVISKKTAAFNEEIKEMVSDETN